MPHLDLDHLFAVFGGGGESRSKVACETAAAIPGSEASAQSGSGSAAANACASDADAAPAESVLLRVRDGVGLVELFGAVLQRDGSTKGTSNPKAAAATRNKGAPRAAETARRLPAGKAAVVIGVLPAAGKVVAQERRAPGPGRRGWRRPAAGARVFATSEAVGAEPVSPKVSCFGAVRSERRASANAPPEKERQEAEERSGCWASVTTALRGVCCSNNPRQDELVANGSDSKATAAVTAAEPPPDAVLSPPPQMAGLGDVKRLASRRWPETMAGEGRGSV
ncbi:hypothetical protein ACP70R_011775 [Stipagrostis hirtigluma subsp. patula]